MGQSSYIQQVMTYFRNVALNAVGVERTFYEYIRDKDIDKAIGMMQDNDIDVDDALKEYNPQMHKIMFRKNKYPKNADPYITCKLPRTRQRYINEVELFFLLGSPIIWNKDNGDDEAYTAYCKFIKDTRFDSNMRRVKRLAGAETESAKLYHIYRDVKTESVQVNVVVLARSTGYSLRPLFDQYGKMTAFAYGYRLKEGGKTIQHWDIQTADFLFYCRKSEIGWEVETLENPTGKINVIYYKQPKAWDGVEPRLEREEELDSKIGDTNNYFADPIASATADVIEAMADPNKPGKLIQLTGQGSRFEYVNPPQSSATREAEKQDLNDSILFDTYTPDFSFENMKGFGTTSGVAIKNAMILGYIKRDNRKEIYGELIDREKNIIKEILKIQNPSLSKKIDELEISFDFGEPFAHDEREKWQSYSNLYTAGLLSLETAVELLSLVDAPQEEIDRIRMANTEKLMADQELQTEKAQERETEQEEQQKEEEDEQQENT